MIAFCSRRAKPNKPELYVALKEIMSLRAWLPVRVVFWHVERSINSMANWLLNVAKELGHSCNCTAWVPPDLGPFSAPPWPAK